MIKREKLSNKNKALTYLLGGTILLSSHVSQGSSPENSFFTDIIHNSYSRSRDTGVSNDGASVAPGMGYYSYTQMPLHRNCLENADDPNVLSFGNPSGSVHLDRTVSLDDMENELNVKIKGRGGYSLFRSSASAQYMKSIQSTRYSQAFNYYQSSFAEASYQYPEYHGESALSPFAQEALAQSAQDFANACGDSYVAMANAGAVLAINVNVEFSSTLEKENFVKSTSIGYLGLGKVTDAVAKARSQYKMNGALSINTLQLGGDPSRLANIFQKGSDGYYFLNCDFDHLSECNKGINGVLDYAKDDFAHQIQFAEGKPVNPNSIYYSSPTMEKYTTLGIHLTLSPPSDEIADKQIELTAWYNKDQENLLFLSHFLNSQMKPFFPQQSDQTLSSFEENLQSRLKEYPYLSVSDACWGPDLSHLCLLAHEGIVKSRGNYPVDEEQIKHFKDDAFQVEWWQWSKSGQYHVIHFVPLAYPQQLYKAFGEYISLKSASGLSYHDTSLSLFYFADDGGKECPYFHNATNLIFDKSRYVYLGSTAVYNKYGNFVANDPTTVMKKENPL